MISITGGDDQAQYQPPNCIPKPGNLNELPMHFLHYFTSTKQVQKKKSIM